MKNLIYILFLISSTAFGQTSITMGLGSSITSDSKGVPVYAHFLLPLGTSEFLSFGFEAHTFQSVGKDYNNKTQEFRSILVTMPYCLSLAEALGTEDLNLDPYLGASFGVLAAINDTENIAPNRDIKFFAFGGIRYFFRDDWGVGAEFSYGYVRSLKLGICIRY